MPSRLSKHMFMKQATPLAMHHWVSYIFSFKVLTAQHTIWVTTSQQPVRWLIEAGARVRSQYSWWYMSTLTNHLNWRWGVVMTISCATSLVTHHVEHSHNNRPQHHNTVDHILQYTYTKHHVVASNHFPSHSAFIGKGLVENARQGSCRHWWHAWPRASLSSLWISSKCRSWCVRGIGSLQCSTRRTCPLPCTCQGTFCKLEAVVIGIEWMKHFWRIRSVEIIRLLIHWYTKVLGDMSLRSKGKVRSLRSKGKMRKTYYRVLR